MDSNDDDDLFSDDSGRWGQGGVFSALSRRSSVPEEQYTQAGCMAGTETVTLALRALTSTYSDTSL